MHALLMGASAQTSKADMDVKVDVDVDVNGVAQTRAKERGRV